MSAPGRPPAESTTLTRTAFLRRVRSLSPVGVRRKGRMGACASSITSRPPQIALCREGGSRRSHHASAHPRYLAPRGGLESPRRNTAPWTSAILLSVTSLVSPPAISHLVRGGMEAAGKSSFPRSRSARCTWRNELVLGHLPGTSPHKQQLPHVCCRPRPGRLGNA